MATFFTSDHHFGHQNIISYTRRPYDSVSEMNDDLVERHNDIVGPNDVVYFLGDVCMGKLDDSLAYISLLNGTKYLIPGNHDRMFGHAKGTAKYDATSQRYLDAGFHGILDSLVRVDFQAVGVAITMCHFPPTGDSHEDDRFDSLRPDMPAHGLLLHGHVHGHYLKKGRCVDVGVDAHAGFPVRLDQIAHLNECGYNVPVSPWLN